eukprot:Rmarinus@m.25985
MVQINVNACCAVAGGISGVLMIVVGILLLAGLSSFQAFVVGCYLLIFGSVIVFLEFKVLDVFTKYFGFLFSWIGKGLFLIFVACLMLGSGDFQTFCGVVVIMVGIMFIILALIGKLQQPPGSKGPANTTQPMLDGQAKPPAAV